jgi:hypothetical protein
MSICATVSLGYIQITFMSEIDVIAFAFRPLTFLVG